MGDCPFKKEKNILETTSLSSGGFFLVFLKYVIIAGKVLFISYQFSPKT